MTWAEYKEIIKNTAYSSDLEYKIHYAWIHGEKTFRADRLLSPETTIVNIPAYISGDSGKHYPIHAISRELFFGNKIIRDIILPSGYVQESSYFHIFSFRPIVNYYIEYNIVIDIDTVIWICTVFQRMVRLKGLGIRKSF